jgi:hypothetical protein
MLTVRTLENIKRGSWITLLNGIYASIFGILYISFMSFILKTNFRQIETVWQVFQKYNPAINFMIVRLMILKAIFIIAIGIVIIYLSNSIIKKKEKPTWVILFIIGLIFWPALLTMEFLDGNIYTIVASFIGWITFIIGMLIPLKYYTQREYSEY